LEAIWLAAVVTVPSAVNPFAHARFDPEKAILVRCWGLMAAAALLVRWVAQLRGWASQRRRVAHAGDATVGGRDPGRAAILWLAGVIASAVLSAGLALSPGTAWFGGVSRGGGVLTLLANAALFLAVATECRGRERVERLLLAIMLGSVMPTVFGWMQVADAKGFAPAGFFPEDRPWSTFGNAIALGSYLAGVIPATAYLVWRTRGWRRALPGLLLLAQVVLLYLTASRGPILGLAAAAAVALLLAARCRGWRNAAVAGAAAFVTLLLVFLGGIQLVAQSDMVRAHARTGMLTRFNTVEVRVQLYKAMTARMLDRRPLATPDGTSDRAGRWRLWIGYGPECLSEPLLSRLESRFEQTEGYDHIPDSTHSQMMDIVGGTGVLGLVLHVGLLGALVGAGRHALGITLTRRQRWICRACVGGTTLAGMLALVLLWGAFAWALGVLAGLYVGLLLATAVALGAERLSQARRAPQWMEMAALAAVPILVGLWVEPQFGIPLVTSSLLFHVGGGLLVALARSVRAPVHEAATASAAAPDCAWIPVTVLGACVLLVSSMFDNHEGLADSLRILRIAFVDYRLWILPVAGGIAAAWWMPRPSLLRVLPLALVGAAFYMVFYAEALTGLRPTTLRSVPDIVAWGLRMQSVAGWRLVPILLLPVLVVAGSWRARVACAVLASASLWVPGDRLWTEMRHDILLVAARQTGNHGEPGAAVQVIENALGTSAYCVHAAQHASQARLFASRAAKAPPGSSERGDAAARWETLLRWAKRAVSLRPLYAPHRGELGAALEEAARATANPERKTALAREAESAYAAAVALTPGTTAHRRRLAGLRYTLLGDVAGARRVLEETLEIDVHNPVALSMLAKWSYQAGTSAVSDDERAEQYEKAVLLAERCLRSPTIAANRVDTRSTRVELATMRQWFLETGRKVPSVPLEVPPARLYVAPKLPTPADRHVVVLLAARAAAALAIALALTPCMRWLARRIGFVDAPAARKLHVEPTPLLGGVAIAVAVAVSSFTVPGSREGLPLAAVLGVAVALAFVGLVDDRTPLPWWLKLFAQCAAAIALHGAGVRVQLAWLPDWTNFAITLVWLVGITNAVNFLDNMNGLSAGLSALAALAVVVLGVLNEGWAVAGMAAAVGGACFGFLRYNHHWRATIFMGDTGSLFLGCCCAFRRTTTG
jgi:UDP-N-acetylmuramyl pentapeptide phosphotransferase/UDP-N-acetylglucosamine-1-phosphate transferase